MNSKKNKNKHRSNKPPNPNPPQKINPTVAEKVNIQPEEKPETIQHVEERVPEIITEIVPTIIESGGKDDETPKKPKRRGKKNKHEKGEQEIQEDQPQVCEEIKIETVDLPQEVTTEANNVTPSARKKKNKNNKTLDSDHKVIEKTQEVMVEPMIDVKSDLVEPKMKESEMSTQCDNAFEKEVKHKKKNKNNKSLDSDHKVIEKTQEVMVEPIKEVKSDLVEPKMKESEMSTQCDNAFEQEVKHKKKNKNNKSLDSDHKVIEKTQEVMVEPMIEVKSDLVEPKMKESEMSTQCDNAFEKEVKHKKKNKNNKSLDSDHKVIEKTQEVMVEPIKEVKSDLVEPKMTESEMSTQCDNAFEQEVKHKKKNKKKKHRTDSERSEKIEDISCVAIKESGSNIKSCSDVEKVSITPDNSAEVLIQSSGKEHVKEITENLLLDTSSDIIAKGEKKNKKDKKHPSKDGDVKEIEQPSNLNIDVHLKSIEDPLLDISDISKEKLTDPIFKSRDTIIDTALQNIILEEFSTDEEIAKSKAMVAKPVERKRKGKPQDQEKESKIESISEDKKDNESKTKPKESESLLQNIVIKDLKAEFCDLRPEYDTSMDISDNKEKVEKNVNMSEIVTGVEEVKKVINIPPPACEMGKKRKKSPKPVKSDHIEKNLSDSKRAPPDKPVSESKEKIQPFLTEIPVKEVTEELDFEKNTQSGQTKLEKSVGSIVSTESKLKDNISECKTKKKGKKSPKPPVQSEENIKEPKEVVQEEPIIISSQETTKENTKKFEIVMEKPDVYSDPTENIEICTYNTDESKESTCGTTPDIIQCPPATNQDVIDNNNNMTIIQEITVEDETKSQIPIDLPIAPFIQGSGKTPMTTSEFIIIDNMAIDTKPKKPVEQEKTDLKSKMMEVNQDMEELRLSIEKSLAELTAIEKSDEEVEKKYSDRILHITEDIDIKPNMPSEIVTKLSIEKSDLTQNKDDKKKKTVLGENKPIEAMQTNEKSSSEKEDNKDINVKIQTDSISLEALLSSESLKPTESTVDTAIPPVCPTRKDHKNKGKNKKKGKQETAIVTQPASSLCTMITEESKEEKDKTKEANTEKKSGTTQEKGKQQSVANIDDENKIEPGKDPSQMTGDFEPIESFEDALTSSVDDINKTFEIIANEADKTMDASHVNPEINIIAPIEDTKKEKRDDKVNPVSQPKNLLGHPDFPVPSNRIDYKKEKNKSPNETLAKVRIKDAIQVESKRESKESQTDNIRKFMKNNDESFALVTNENEDFVYKYSFRKVFLQSACHVCKKDLKQAKIPCSYCNLVFYCNVKHKDEDWPQHQALCFAVSTIVHLKDQKHIYVDSKDITGQNYRLLRMQMIVSCEKVLKRHLVPWEQEALLYPRVCAAVSCREWRQSKLVDCKGCGQISYCAEHPDHYPKIHQRWCKSYLLYSKLVCYQQTKGRLEPKMPSKVMIDYKIPDKMNEVLASMYDEKIDMNEIEYAALTQIATAPLTAAYCYQTYTNHSIHINGTSKKSTCTIHVVGAELQFEADALNKWEVFFLHLIPGVNELRVVLIASDLNPSNLPLELLSKVKLCENCRLNNRRVIFNFQDKKSYHEYCSSEEYIQPNIVCTFNVSINRSSLYNSKDPWPKTINCILKQRVPFLITSYTINEIHRDLYRIKECAEYKYNIIIEPKNNSFASVRPDRNFISDDEMPLLFKNYCYLLVCGVC